MIAGIWIFLAILALCWAAYQAVAPVLFLLWPADNNELEATLRQVGISHQEASFAAWRGLALSGAVVAVAVAVIVAVVQGRLG